MRKLPVTKVTHWKAPSKNDVRVLGMPNIPDPLHGPGCQPRTIAGSKVWDQMRKRCYADAGYKCEVCGYEHEKPADLHCLERGTEVLTTEGWTPIENVTKQDVVAQFSPENNSISFVHPTAIIAVHSDKIIRIGYKNRFQVGYSPNHRILLSKGEEWLVKTPMNIPIGDGRYKIPSSAYGYGDGALSANEKIYIALNADGSLEDVRKDGSFVFRIMVSKERKKQRLRHLLSESSLEYWERPEKGRPQYLCYVVKTNCNCKDFWRSFDVSMPYAKASEFIDELIKWDGWEGTRTSHGKTITGRCWYTTKQSQADFVQAIAAQAAIKTHISITKRLVRDWEYPGRVPTIDCKPQMNVEFLSRNGYGLSTMMRRECDYDDDVFCITVPSHYFVARSKDKYIFITGNCHEVFDIDYEKGISEFKRTICLCPMCHLRFIHSGRALTFYKHGDPLYSKERLLEGAEHGFKLIADYNKEHKRKIKVFSTIATYTNEPELRDDMLKLIDKYGIEFYGPIGGKKQAKWGDWRMVWNGKSYFTPYKDSAEHDEKMREMNKKQDRFGKVERMSGGVFDELDKLLKGE